MVIESISHLMTQRLSDNDSVTRLIGDLAADLFKIGHVIEGRALIFGVAVPADPKGHSSLDASLFRMFLPFSVASLALHPLKIKRNLGNGPKLSGLPVACGVARQAFLLRIFRRRGNGLGSLGVWSSANFYNSPRGIITSTDQPSKVKWGGPLK